MLTLGGVCSLLLSCNLVAQQANALCCRKCFKFTYFQSGWCVCPDVHDLSNTSLCIKNLVLTKQKKKNSDALVY
uniref:Putative secreted protein synganglion overexpressed n=1 Tax=Rhipicephalus microplus TaxID=6941 RepID=A0A6M2DBJ1_RHIMP